MIEPRIWDITQRVHPDIPLWPGEPPVSISQHAQIGPQCPVNIGAVSMPLHTGTHADAPYHYAENGAFSGDCDLAPYIGRCVLLDVSGAGKTIELADCNWDQIKGQTRVLLRTYESFPHDCWDEQFTAISPQVVERMAQLGVSLIGVDTASLDPQNSKTMEAHHRVLAADMRILEGLVLENVPAGEYELIALPLKLAGADASPVRAILRELV